MIAKQLAANLTAVQSYMTARLARTCAMATSARPCFRATRMSTKTWTWHPLSSGSTTRFWLSALLALSLVEVAAGQSAPLPAPANTPAPSTPTVPRAPELRIVPTQQGRPIPSDPTMPSPEIRSLLDGERTTPNATAASPNPTIRLRARVIARGKPGLAVIDIDGSLITVREGDEVSVTVGAGSVPIVITKLTATDLQVEIGARKQLLNVN